MLSYIPIIPRPFGKEPFHHPNILPPEPVPIPRRQILPRRFSLQEKGKPPPFQKHLHRFTIIQLLPLGYGVLKSMAKLVGAGIFVTKLVALPPPKQEGF